MNSTFLTKEDIIEALRFRNEAQQELFSNAREARARFFDEGDVEVRSVLEVSNVCHQNCRYCNMACRRDLDRYTLSTEQIESILTSIYERGRRFLLLQSGENRSREFLASVAAAIRGLKKRFPDLVFILCLGALGKDDYQMLRDNGADRYILKFETSSPELYKTMKPGGTLQQRLQSLQWAIDAGLQVGTGNIVGLPYQTLENIAEDLLLTLQFDLAMVSASVFIPGEGSALADHPAGCVDTTLNAMALLRTLHPSLRIPTTSSLEKVRKGAQLEGLRAGANTVTIHDATPKDYKALFPIYSLNRIVPDEQHCMGILKESLRTGAGMIQETKDHEIH